MILTSNVDVHFSDVCLQHFFSSSVICTWYKHIIILYITVLLHLALAQSSSYFGWLNVNKFDFTYPEKSHSNTLWVFASSEGKLLLCPYLFNSFANFSCGSCREKDVLMPWNHLLLLLTVLSARVVFATSDSF